MWNGDVSQGHVKETKAAEDELAEVGAVAKGSDDPGLWEGFSGIEDVEVGSEQYDEAADKDLLGLKAMKQLVARQSRRGLTKAGGEVPDRRRRRN